MTRKLSNSERIEIYNNEIFKNSSNEDLVEAILTWDNNEFTEEKMRAMLLQDNKESNLEKLINKLSERYDLYVISFMAFLEFKSFKLNDDLQAIVQTVFEEFGLTNDVSKRELNRSQVENLSSDGDLKQAIYDFINDCLVNLVEDDEDIEKLIPQIFVAVMVEMLYFESSPIGLSEYKYALKNLDIL